MRIAALVAMLSLGFVAGCAEDEDLSESPPNETLPGEDSAAPEDSTAPDSATDPDTGAEPDTAVEPDTATPDTFVADTSMPDTFVADTSTPDTFVPDTFVPDTAKPDTFVPDTFVPDTFVPDTAPVDTCVVNACGGCTILAAPPGFPCGTCGGGMYTCSGTDVVVCTGATPLNACGGCATLTAAPGTACGTCGGMYTCSGANAVACTGSMPLNACGGCNTLTNPPTTACGICGTYGCSSTTTTTCNETASIGTDLTYTATTDYQAVYNNALAFAYPVRHRGRITSVAFRVARYFVAFGPPPEPWTLTIEAVRGTPSAPGAVLATATYTASNTPAIPTWSPTAPTTPTSRITFNLPSTVTLNVSDPVFFRITRVSANNYFLFWGANAGGPADVTTHSRDTATAPWTTVAFDPDIVVQMNGCF